MIGNLIVRLIAILFALLLAYLAAGMFLAVGMFLGWFRYLFAAFTAESGGVVEASDVLAAIATFAVALFSSFTIAIAATAPALLAIAIAEAMRWRSLAINLLLGGGVALATDFITTTPDSTPLSQGAALVLLSTGFIAGFVYWLVAGRNAGRWLDVPQIPARRDAAGSQGPGRE